MAASSRFAFPIHRLPTIGGLAGAAVAGSTIALLSTAMLAHLAAASDIAALIRAAQSPVGSTERLLLAGGGAVAAGAVVWAALFLLFGPGGFLAPTPLIAEKRPTVRRADAHPDAPPRWPMTAADLGTPLMEVVPTPPVERPWPRDLDQTLATFDPAAVPRVPRQPLRAVPSLATGRRLDTFAPLRLAASPADRGVKREPTSAESIEALLRRLEQGAGRRTAQRA